MQTHVIPAKEIVSLFNGVACHAGESRHLLKRMA